MHTLKESIKSRRSYYSISKKSTLSDKNLIDLVETALQHTPSAFNMQSARIVLLLGKNHDLFWDNTLKILQQIVPAEKFSDTENRISGFSAGYGTILFFDDIKTIQTYAQHFSLYKESFPIWAQQANGMLQSNIWMLLEDAGFGASLQHYNPLIDESVHKIWDIPESWQLIAQMPFGKPTALPEDKDFAPLENRIKVFGK